MINDLVICGNDARIFSQRRHVLRQNRDEEVEVDVHHAEQEDEQRYASTHAHCFDDEMEVKLAHGAAKEGCVAGHHGAVVVQVRAVDDVHEGCEGACEDEDDDENASHVVKRLAQRGCEDGDGFVVAQDVKQTELREECSDGEEGHEVRVGACKTLEVDSLA